jgi:hypothetical protein
MTWHMDGAVNVCHQAFPEPALYCMLWHIISKLCPRQTTHRSLCKGRIYFLCQKVFWINQGAFSSRKVAGLSFYPISLLLQKYGDSSFQSCKDETEEVMEKVIRHMEDLVVSDAADTDDRAEAVQLLEQLNQPVGHEFRKFGRPVCACWVSMS